MRVLVVAFLAALIAPASAMADEIVYFTNGTSMAIHGHTVAKDMITVEFDASSKMAFPAYMVDKIEVAGRNVYVNPIFHPANQAVSANEVGSTPIPAESEGMGAGTSSRNYRSAVEGPSPVPQRQYLSDPSGRTSQGSPMNDLRSRLTNAYEQARRLQSTSGPLMAPGEVLNPTHTLNLPSSSASSPARPNITSFQVTQPVVANQGAPKAAPPAQQAPQDPTPDNPPPPPDPPAEDNPPN